MNKLLYLLLFFICSLLFSSCNNKVSNTKTAQSVQTTDSITLVKLNRAKVCAVNVTSTSTTPVKFYISPARYNFQNYQTLLADIIKGESTDKEKAIAIWKFTENWTYHSQSAMRERLPHDPLRLFNSFESGLCDDRNAALTNMFLLAGLQARAYHLEGHVVAEVFYENAWHMYDADWNLYFKDDKGDAASVEYLSNHPEAICKERSSGGEGWLKFSLGMMILKHDYTTKQNNHIGTWYTDMPLNYTNKIQLAKGDVLNFNYSVTDNIDKVQLLIAQHAVINNKRTGMLSRQVADWNAKRINSNEWVMAENLPYAVKIIHITAKAKADIKSDIKIYYSPDGNKWYYKGVITPGFSSVRFNVFDAENQPVAFNYFIKFSGANVNVDFDKRALIVENSFLFSDKLFLNADNAFKLVYLQPQHGGYLNINCTAEDE